jgi:hypothetical protein
MSSWEAYYCNQHLTKELSDRIYVRNNSSEPLEAHINCRSVDTRRTMPINDCRKKSTVPIAKYPKYEQHKQFNPGYGAPFNGYCNNIDRESVLFNYINPLQKAQQGLYIPSSKSDLFNHIHYSPSDVKNLAQNEENFAPFNPNECNIGARSFNNHTRQQTKNIK